MEDGGVAEGGGVLVGGSSLGTVGGLGVEAGAGAQEAITSTTPAEAIRMRFLTRCSRERWIQV